MIATGSVPVLEVGGTHVSAAMIHPDGWRVGVVARADIDADAGADELLDELVRSGATLQAPRGATWGVAMPDPFDYRRGVALFAGVGKFAALHGVDVAAALRSRLGGPVTFVNDADAFLLGEWVAGAARGAHRCAGMTLGTGVGTGWLVDGEVTDPGSPPGGRLHRLEFDGAPLEQVVSRRAIRRSFAAAGGRSDADVREIAALARHGDRTARDVLDAALGALGSVMGQCLVGFEADVLVVGGSMARSWDLFEPAFRAGAVGATLPRIRLAAHPRDAGLIGAARHATGVHGASR